MQLAGKTTLITEAARRIGRAYTSAGARVMRADIDAYGADVAARGMNNESGEVALSVQMDVSDQDSVDAAVAETVRLFGKIINMASQAGRHSAPVVAVCCATKAAVISLSQSAGLDLIKHGINITAISPGVEDYIVAQTYNVDGGQWMS